jgi:integrase
MPKLTALSISKLKNRGLYGDGDGLYLQITARGSKSWIFRYRADGKLRDHGLGSVKTLTLAEAREVARNCRKLRLQGIDPIDHKQQLRTTEKLEAAKAISFQDCAQAYIEAHKASWKNDKHAAQWTATLKTYAYPVFGDLPVAAVDIGLVLKAIEPIWTTKTETASRVRGRIENILDFATVRGYRTGENPARLRGNLEHTLPARNKVRRVKHHPALPYAEMPDFWKALSKQSGTAAQALRFTILTAARTGEVIGATWDEIDLEENVWTIPAERMKAGNEHRVPLSDATVAILKAMKKEKRNDYIFPGLKKDKPLSNMSLLKVLKDMGRGDLTVHGFRSTFRDWTAECTDTPREVAEAALAHTLENKVEAAYRRSDLFDKRRSLMVAWSRHFSQ